MGMKHFRPTTPSLRNMTVSTYEEITKKTPEKTLLATKKKNALWNTNFQTYNPPMAYKILEQDKKGGAMIVMIGAAILGLIIAACVGVI